MTLQQERIRPSEVWVLDEYDVAILDADSAFMCEKLSRMEYLMSLGIADASDQRETMSIIRECIDHLSEIRGIGKDRGILFSKYSDRLQDALIKEASA